MNFAPKNAIDALRLAKCNEKAKAALLSLNFTLWFDGGDLCTVDSWKEKNGVAVYDRYEVDMAAGSCTCMDFAQHKDFCKHTCAVDIENEAAEEAQMWEVICAKAEADAIEEANALFA